MLNKNVPILTGTLSLALFLFAYEAVSTYRLNHIADLIINDSIRLGYIEAILVFALAANLLVVVALLAVRFVTLRRRS